MQYWISCLHRNESFQVILCTVWITAADYCRKIWSAINFSLITFDRKIAKVIKLQKISNVTTLRDHDSGSKITILRPESWYKTDQAEVSDLICWFSLIALNSTDQKCPAVLGAVSLQQWSPLRYSRRTQDLSVSWETTLVSGSGELGWILYSKFTLFLSTQDDGHVN